MADNSNSSAQTLSQILGDDGKVYKKVFTNASKGAVATAISNIKNLGKLPILCASTYGDDSSQVWLYDPTFKTIQNVKTNLYAYPEGGKAVNGVRIITSDALYNWDVTSVNGLFTIGAQDVYWTVEDARNWTSIILKEVDTLNPDNASLWSFSSA